MPDGAILFVEKEESAGQGYDLSINMFIKVEYVSVNYPSTREIMAKLHELERKISRKLAKLDKMLMGEEH